MFSCENLKYTHQLLVVPTSSAGHERSAITGCFLSNSCNFIVVVKWSSSEEQAWTAAQQQIVCKNLNTCFVCIFQWSQIVGLTVAGLRNLKNHPNPSGHFVGILLKESNLWKCHPPEFTSWHLQYKSSSWKTSKLKWNTKSTQSQICATEQGT